MNRTKVLHPTMLYHGLTVTKVVFEFVFGGALCINFFRLTVTKVVFECGKLKICEKQV